KRAMQKIGSESAVLRCQTPSQRAYLAILSYHPHSLVHHGASSGLKTEHRGMVCLQHLAVPQIHVHAARQTRIETSYRAHDIDSLELVRAVFFEDRSILHR